MLNLSKILTSELDWSPNSGREVAPAYEWEALKESVDEIRDGYYSGGAIEILKMVGVWDERAHYIDEETLTQLYMEHS